MNIDTFTYLLDNPSNVHLEEAKALEEVIEAFPYFQSARALHLKGLKNQHSFSYNKRLKETAAYTTDRSVLFEYITSDIFSQSTISIAIQAQDKDLKNLAVQDAVDLSLQVDREEQEKASKILDPGLFVEKKDSEMTKNSPEEILSVGAPLEFTNIESHSFMEWLQLSNVEPIQRKTPEEKEKKENKLPSKTESLPADLEESDRKRKQEIIDSFIETKPKIAFLPLENIKKNNIANATIIPAESLMTETLARVYVEQKNYKKAKQAFRILILKYPEKSGFFADQIRAVEQLEAKD